MENVIAYSLFTDFDIDLFKAGKHFRLYEKFGSHITTLNGVEGTYFAVWAPSAKAVSVIGDFNYWTATPLRGFHKKGTFEVIVDKKNYTINSGDGFYFNSKLPHLFKNTIPLKRKRVVMMTWQCV